MALGVCATLSIALVALNNKTNSIVIQTDTSTNTVSKTFVDHSLLLNPKHNDQENFIKSISKRLQQEHSHEIHLIPVQISMQDFRNFIREEHPSDSQIIFTRIMHLAFPKYADDILSLITSLDLYDQWYLDNLLNLNDMDPLSKKGRIWQKRREIFGDLADQIWQQEINNEEEKRQVVQQTISRLDNANDIPMNERLYILQNTLNEQYPHEQTSFTMNKGLISNVYFQLESVQNDLKNMSLEQRELALAQSRRQLGFSQEDIDKLAEEDKQKEQRWQNGYQYMSAKEQIEQTYSGDVLNKKLKTLREKHFKHEANTISAEEESGFYRYNRPRLYGSN